MRRNKLMTLALAVICGVSVMTTSVKAEAMYYETEDGITTDSLMDEIQERTVGAKKVETPTNLRVDTLNYYTTTLTWNPVKNNVTSDWFDLLYKLEFYKDESLIWRSTQGHVLDPYDGIRYEGNFHGLEIVEEKGTGNYTIKVKCCIDGNESDWAVIEYSYIEPGNKLNTPTNIKFDKQTGIVTWERVEGAAGYEVILYRDGKMKVGSRDKYTNCYADLSRWMEDEHVTYTVGVIARPSDINIISSSDEGSSEYTNEQKEQVRNFVSRLYRIILNREADEGGLNAWTQQLLDRTATGAQIVGGFVESDEFTQRGLTNEEVVEIMYQAMLDRDSDDAGREGWTKILNGGCSYIYIVNGFSGSAEFNGVCNTYGIDAGIVNTDRKRDRNPQLTQFVSRCYTQALGRQYETNGLEDWCDAIISGRNTPKEAAQMFIFSDEFIQKNLNNEEYVRVLYRTFMGREADEDGLAAWVEVLESGREDRMKVLEGFSDSVEFDGILQSFGLK